MDARDFNIHIHAGDGPGAFRVSVRSPAGEGRGALRVPDDWLEHASRPSAVFRDLTPAPAEPKARRGGASGAEALGTRLFDALVRDEVLRLYDRSRGSGAPLRLRLELDLDEPGVARIAELPWELLYDARRGEFLALGRRTPVLRSLHAPRRVPVSALPSPLRILGVISRPAGLEPLALDREWRLLERAWRGVDGVEFGLAEGVDLGGLRRRLLDGPWHVLHFMGHGGVDPDGEEGVLVLEDGAGGPAPVGGRELAERLQDTGVRLVVLNACETGRVGSGSRRPAFAGVASALARAGAPAVVAMQRPVTDAASLAFSSTLYRRVAAGDPVDLAVTEARLAVAELDGSAAGTDGALPEWAVPVLFLRAPDGRIFHPPGRGAREPVLKRGRIRRTGRGRVWGATAGAVGLLGLALAIGADLWTWWGALDRLVAGDGPAAVSGPSTATPPADGCVQEVSEQATGLSDRGLLLAREGRLDLARSTLVDALDEAPGLAAAHTNMAYVDESAGRGGRALEHYRMAARLLPACALHQYNLGAAARSRGHTEEALAALERAISLDPRYVEAYNELGNLYLDLERPADARRVLETGIGLAPERPVLFKNLGRTAFAETRFDEAAERLETALDLYPAEDWRAVDETTYWLAASRAESGRQDEACRLLGRFRHRLRPAITAWEERAEVLGREQRCGTGA